MKAKDHLSIQDNPKDQRKETGHKNNNEFPKKKNSSILLDTQNPWKKKSSATQSKRGWAQGPWGP